MSAYRGPKRHKTSRGGGRPRPAVASVRGSAEPSPDGDLTPPPPEHRIRGFDIATPIGDLTFAACECMGWSDMATTRELVTKLGAQHVIAMAV